MSSKVIPARSQAGPRCSQRISLKLSRHSWRPSHFVRPAREVFGGMPTLSVEARLIGPGLRRLPCHDTPQRGTDQAAAVISLPLSAACGRLHTTDGHGTAPRDLAQASSGSTIADRVGSGWVCMARTNGPSATTTALAPMATANARYSVS